ncbi:Protein of unknown function (DUF2637) [Micromonospora sediminicola]|uniref:DUF2637 domain-containing protein n=1 Tax=Micromonospora sediminicola TaxID=946078 RepID=A0A1A9B2E7_9ACTN|nr:DUF2637 domain-containing protein [Micromonospora sediminicola]SBT63071.1 Protein of unknown function (DUF2637) [Micromonospora sediminicola]SBT63092.1 Protein of unknown function (DUF2637) [Micromonospora sediminicola]SBT63101.1 Protein of unknown function (DUF2637) [Micromonospora sediminicola]SBT63102.1 Protein of unknown function (DUF2637) [Micromonospora sediminicola]
MTTLQHGTDLTQLAATDAKVARNLAAAERERLAVQTRIASEDAASERQLRAKAEQLRLAAQKDANRDARAERRRKQQENERADRKARRQARRAELAGWYAGRVAYVRDNAAAVYSGLIYGLAVSGAVYGQVDAARANNLPTPIGVIAAVAIEGTGLAMALTAQHQRLNGERAMVARALIWICTAAAVSINAIGHHADPVKAIGLSALSALGIIVYEVRSGAKHRPALRAKGMIPEPPERFGWRRWLTYPRQTREAWKTDVRDRLSPGAAALIARAEARRAEQHRQAAIEAERERQQKVVAEVAAGARKALRKATGKDSGAALAALARLAATGTPAPLLALPSPGRAEAEAARADAAEARRALAEAEARADAADARAEAATVRRAEAEAEARAAIERAEAEATHRARAEAEAATATRRAEAEAHAAALARRAEAEARTALERALAEAEAARAEARAETGRASRTQGQLDAAGAEWQRRLQTAETALGQARRELSEQQHARHRAEALAEAAKQDAADLRAALAQAAADAGRRPRRTPAGSSKPAEPVLFEGKPVPHVDRVSPETVRAVLQARKDHPDATQKDLAPKVGTSERTVRTVLTAVAAAKGSPAS